MFAVLINTILFFGIPAILLIFAAISLRRYRSAKEQNEDEPDTYSAEEIKRRKIMMIIAYVVLGVIAAVVIGFIALFFMAIAFM